MTTNNQIDIDNLHTTEMGVLRVKRNLELESDNVVEWCKDKVRASDNITRKGKNWYVCIGDVTITINVYSNTIITAHRNKKILAL